MAGPTSKKRNHQDFASKSKSKTQKPNKKQRKLMAYNSDSDEEEANPGFKPVNLMDSDNEDLDNAVVDDGASSSGSGSGSDNESDSDNESVTSARQTLKKPKKPTTSKALVKVAQDAPLSDGDEDDDDEDDAGDSDADSYDLESDEDGPGSRNTKSKRNDNTKFALSAKKILETKLSTTRRVDPVLSRSSEAHKASKEIVDAALEAKARKQMRQQKLLALEKGRVRDVLVATRNEVTDELENTTAEILETERRLRKVAQRGVVKLFNAVRIAQVRGQEADVQARKDGFVGVKSREEKVSEMSRKGFLDLIASGGGGLSKAALEEA